MEEQKPIKQSLKHKKENKMELRAHIATLLLAIIFMNIVEYFHTKPFDNKSCKYWYVPTGSAVLLVAVVEAVYWLIRWGYGPLLE